jgi:hypothetical protein
MGEAGIRLDVTHGISISDRYFFFLRITQYIGDTPTHAHWPVLVGAAPAGHSDKS